MKTKDFNIQGQMLSIRTLVKVAIRSEYFEESNHKS